MSTQPQDATVAGDPHGDGPPTDETASAARADEGDAQPLPAGDDVRVGPEQSDEPQAGSAEPAD